MYSKYGIINKITYTVMIKSKIKATHFITVQLKTDEPFDDVSLLLLYMCMLVEYL